MHSRLHSLLQVGHSLLKRLAGDTCSAAGTHSGAHTLNHGITWHCCTHIQSWHSAALLHVQRQEGRGHGRQQLGGGCARELRARLERHQSRRRAARQATHAGAAVNREDGHGACSDLPPGTGGWLRMPYACVCVACVCCACM